MTEKVKHITYADAGVDVDEGARAVDAIKECVKSTRRPEVIGGLGGFGSLFSAASIKEMEDPILVSGTDGVGTKLAIAQLLDKHDAVGQDLVAMCVDDIVVSGAEPLFFLDYVAIGKIKAEHMKEIVEGIAEGCKMSHCALVGGEMAEHPGVMSEDDYDLAGFVVGVVDRPQVISPDNVEVGDKIIGLASSGIHSNGYSLVRKAIIENRSIEELREKREDLGGRSIAEAVLEPTKIYAGGLIDILHDGVPIHAMAHITGGGITENLNRALKPSVDALVYRNGDRGPSWEIPPIIDFVVREAGLSLDEAYKTFNMGVGMSVICADEDVDITLQALEDKGFNPFIMGEIIEGVGKVVYRD